MRTDERTTGAGGDGGDNVIRFPRDWFGSTEDLIPFGPSADRIQAERAAKAAQAKRDAGENPADAPGSPGIFLVPDGSASESDESTDNLTSLSASDFWGGDAEALHQPMEAVPVEAPAAASCVEADEAPTLTDTHFPSGRALAPRLPVPQLPRFGVPGLPMPRFSRFGVPGMALGFRTTACALFVLVCVAFIAMRLTAGAGQPARVGSGGSGIPRATAQRTAIGTASALAAVTREITSTTSSVTRTASRTSPKSAARKSRAKETRTRTRLHVTHHVVRYTPPSASAPAPTPVVEASSSADSGGDATEVPVSSSSNESTSGGGSGASSASAAGGPGGLGGAVGTNCDPKCGAN